MPDTLYFDSASPRARSLAETFRREFGAQPSHWFSAPGRTELGGNHTDHQGGCVLAAAVDADMLCCARASGTDCVRVSSAGYRPFTVSLSDTEKVRPGTSAALVQGMAQLLRDGGYSVGGADICLHSNVPNGAGLSSSAAFEVLVGQVFHTLFCGGALSPLQLAQMGQQAENRWFGKPCGLMDQLACAVGGVVSMDFAGETPQVEKLTLSDADYDLCLTDVGAGHQNLTDCYAAIPAEMAAVAACFGKARLSEVAAADFWDAFAALRQKTGDRPVLRAAHYFEEVQRVRAQRGAIASGDFPAFLHLVRASGRSSALYLQNLYAVADSQPMTAALAYGEHLLAGQGACRVHGGGFGGTVQAWVPRSAAADFCAAMERTIGASRRLSIREAGVVTLS